MSFPIQLAVASADSSQLGVSKWTAMDRENSRMQETMAQLRNIILVTEAERGKVLMMTVRMQLTHVARKLAKCQNQETKLIIVLTYEAIRGPA